MLLIINNSGGQLNRYYQIRWNRLKKITLVEGEEIINEDGENAEILNTFFSNAVKNLKIPKYQETDLLANNISHPIFKAILKYRNHPSIVGIKNLNKGIQYKDLPVKILKENSDTFGNYTV